MISFFKKLFKTKTFVGWNVYNDKELVGLFRFDKNSPGVALKAAELKLMHEFFRSGSTEGLILNLRAEPAYKQS